MTQVPTYFVQFCSFAHSINAQSYIFADFGENVIKDPFKGLRSVCLQMAGSSKAWHSSVLGLAAIFCP